MEALLAASSRARGAAILNSVATPTHTVYARAGELTFYLADVAHSVSPVTSGLRQELRIALTCSPTIAVQL